MSSKPRNYLMGALMLAEGLCAISVILIWLLRWPLQDKLADTLFLEGAVLLVVGGFMDIGRSITFEHIRALRNSSIGDPPQKVKKHGFTYVFLIAGLLLCVQGALLVHLFPAAQP